MFSTWQSGAEDLAKTLFGKVIVVPRWREAFARTPRHVLVPFFYDGGTAVTADRSRGLRQIYSDRALVTRIDRDGGPATACVDNRPSLLALMLSLLGAVEGDQVLEIGTGTGYHTALLCFCLGDTNVTSVDADYNVVTTAKARLAGVGHRPFLVAADPIGGVPLRAPFSRIIATAAVSGIAAAWISQLVQGGRVVADICGPLASALLVADKTTDTSVRGRFHGIAANLMPLRRQIDQLSSGVGPVVHGWCDVADRWYAATGDLPADVFDDRNFRFLLQLAVPGLGHLRPHAPDGRRGVFVHADSDGSWMFYQPTGPTGGEVEYGGPRALWPEIADLWKRWHRWSRPPVQRFGMTYHDDGRAQLWLDHESAVVLSVKPDEVERHGSVPDGRAES